MIFRFKKKHKPSDLGDEIELQIGHSKSYSLSVNSL